MDASTCRTAGLVLSLALALAAVGVAQDLRISENRIDHPSTDTDEYFELAGPPGSPLDGLPHLVIGDGAAGSGVIEEVTGLTRSGCGASTPRTVGSSSRTDSSQRCRRGLARSVP